MSDKRPHLVTLNRQTAFFLLTEMVRPTLPSFSFTSPWVVDADLQSYFDTIPKQPLLALIQEKVSDSKVVGLLKRFLEQAVMEGMERWTPLTGTAQGSVLSPLLANLYLQGLDERMSEAGNGHRYARFADDFVVLCRSGW